MVIARPAVIARQAAIARQVVIARQVAIAAGDRADSGALDVEETS